MTILVTGANGQLGNEMRVVTKGSKYKFIFTDVCDEHPKSLEMLHKLGGVNVDTSTTKLDITNMEYAFFDRDYRSFRDGVWRR